MASHQQHSVKIPAGRRLDADEITRLLDGIDHAEPVDCYQAFRDSEIERAANRKLDRRIAIACALIAVIASIYFIAELLRTATH